MDIENKFHVWIVTDARRRTDLEYFKASYSKTYVKTVRVLADERIRSQRNWFYTEGIKRF